MPVKIDFTEISNVLKFVKEVQDAEQDMRAQVSEAKLFVAKRDGQWDPYAWQKMKGRYRGSFDMVTPVIDNISGEIDQSNFSLKVSPSGGKASGDTAKTLNGLVRNIRNISGADQIFNAKGRSNVIGGFDCVEITQDWVDGDSFDQDLFIRNIPNAVNSVWFDLASVRQDRSDSRWGVKLAAIPTATYQERWPEGSGQSVSQGERNNAFWQKASMVNVGQLYYKKRKDIELVQMTDGSVYQDNDDFKKVKNELEAEGITIEKDNDGKEKRRTRKSWRVFSRMFDGGKWLEDEKETVFDFVPLAPIYGNFDIIEDKPVYFGKIENLYDSQRALNYATSRDIEDGSLSPAATVWMTEVMAQGHDYSQMNTDHKPVRTFNIDPENPGLMPNFTGGPQPSAGLQTTIQNMQQMINSTSNMFNAQQGNAAPNQSGIAGLLQVEQGNVGNIKWFTSMEIMICHVGKILINAIPRVYDGTRQVRILEEDGTSSIVPINKTVFDEDSGKNVVLNDLTVGEYDVVCDVGPAFNSQQKETAKGFLELGAIDPSIVARNKDILLGNLATPGMDVAADRERAFLFKAGEIPEDQWTEEEQEQVQKAQAQAAQQQQQPDLQTLIVQTEFNNSQANLTRAQNESTEIQFKAASKAADIESKDKKTQSDLAVDAAKIQQGDRKLDQSEQQMQINARQEAVENAVAQQNQEIQLLMQATKQAVENLNTQADTWKKLREAQGIDVFTGTGGQKAFIEQAEIIQDTQERLPVERAETGVTAVVRGPNIEGSS